MVRTFRRGGRQDALMTDYDWLELRLPSHEHDPQGFLYSVHSPFYMSEQHLQIFS